jgi:hypothetical protein
MPKKASDDLSRKGEPDQRTKKGLKIPVPKRGDFLRDLGKVAPTPPPESEPEPRRTRRDES